MIGVGAGDEAVREHIRKSGRSKASVDAVITGEGSGFADVEVAMSGTGLVWENGFSRAAGRESPGSSPVGFAKMTLDIEAKMASESDSCSRNRNSRWMTNVLEVMMLEDIAWEV